MPAHRFIIGLALGTAIAGYCQPSLAQSQTLAVCGASAGQAYYAFRGAVSKDDSGWRKDGISKGSTQLIRDGQGDYDIVFIDATGVKVSSVADGAKILLLANEPDALSLFVVYPSTRVFEVYSFFWERDGRPKVVIQQTKIGGTHPFQQVSVLLADCSRLKLR